VQKSGKQMN